MLLSMQITASARDQPFKSVRYNVSTARCVLFKIFFYDALFFRILMTQHLSAITPNCHYSCRMGNRLMHGCRLILECYACNGSYIVLPRLYPQHVVTGTRSGCHGNTGANQAPRILGERSDLIPFLRRIETFTYCCQTGLDTTACINLSISVFNPSYLFIIDTTVGKGWGRLSAWSPALPLGGDTVTP